MKNVRVDSDGELRCWKCGSKDMLGKRTGRAHVVGYVTVGIGALATKKKLKCQACGSYNDTGSAEKYAGPADRSLGKKLGTLAESKGAQTEAGRAFWAEQRERSATGAASEPASTPSVADQLRELKVLVDEGVLTEAEFEAKKAQLLGL